MRRTGSNTPFRKGMIDGTPIGLGYFAVAFSLGIVARQAGLSPALGFVSSLLTRASAGEYGGYSLIAAGAAVIEIVAVCFIANMRYLLMGAALSQKFADDMPLWKRMICACCITDEIFGISISYPGKLPVAYPLGATVIAATMWALGTALGITAGNLLPKFIVDALGVALYGMFLAIIIPPCRKNKYLLEIVAASFCVSILCTKLPPFSTISPGIRIVILTVALSAVAAMIKPFEYEE